VRVQEYQLSLFWVRTVPERWRYQPLADYTFLADETAYRAAFRNVEREKGKPTGFAVPWLAKERFWARYTARPAPRSRADLAWRWSLPLYVHAPLRLARPGDGAARGPAAGWRGYAYTGRYLYPHGVTLVMHFRGRGDLSLQELATTVRNLRHARFEVNGRQLVLDQIAAQELDACGVLAWGRECTLRGAGAEPFSVFTVIRASGADWARPAEDGGGLHQFLDQVSGWYDRHRDPDCLEAARVSSARRDGHILYGHRRSRCVWFPEHFETADVRFSLSHYHRNLTFCSLQTESLGQYVATAAADLDEPGYLSIPQKDYARHVVRSLERLLRGRPEETYRSRSPQRQLEANGVLADLERVKAYLATQ